MPSLSASDLAATARAGGFSGSDVPVAVAVALAESGGNPHAHNPLPPDDSYGLWQINMIGPLGPARRKTFGLSSNDQLYDPLTNARAAHAIWSGRSGWRAWSTFTSGAYLKYLPQAQGVGEGTVPAATVPAGSSTADLSGITDFGTLLETPGTWWRVGYVIGGGIMLVIAARTVLKHNGLAKVTS